MNSQANHEVFSILCVVFTCTFNNYLIGITIIVVPRLYFSEMYFYYSMSSVT